METVRKKTPFGIIAGVLFIVAIAYYVWNYMQWSSWPLTIIGLLNLGTLICIAAGLFRSQTKAGKILVLVGSIVRAVYPFFNVQAGYYMIACFGFLLLAVAAILAMSNGGLQLLGKTWFIPGLVMAAYAVLFCIRIPEFWNHISPVDLIGQMMPPCLIAAGTVLGGLALAKPEKTVTQPIPAAKRMESLQAVEELKKYKELLDSGVISQDEFDAKKNQLLGL